MTILKGPAMDSETPKNNKHSGINVKTAAPKIGPMIVWDPPNAVNVKIKRDSSREKLYGEIKDI
jgi:hypothetical protein